MLELIAKDPQAFILKQGWASVSLDPERGLLELRSLYEHLQAKILEMIETLDELRASAEMEIFREVEQDENAIDRIAAAQRVELELEIAGLNAEADRVAEEGEGTGGRGAVLSGKSSADFHGEHTRPRVWFSAPSLKMCVCHGRLTPT